jgi:Gram-negative bacterial TonB protein C-terminal
MGRIHAVAFIALCCPCIPLPAQQAGPDEQLSQYLRARRAAHPQIGTNTQPARSDVLTVRPPLSTPQTIPAAVVGVQEGRPAADCASVFPSPDAPTPLRVDLSHLPPDVRQEMSLQEGEIITPDQVQKIVAEARSAGYPLSTDIESRSVVHFYYWPPIPPAEAARIRVGSRVQARLLLSGEPPEYPPAALPRCLEGDVRLGVLIDGSGDVQAVEAWSGPHLLAETAAEAVRKWIYRATLLNGEPVEVLTTVDFRFKLTQEPN